MNWLQNLFFNQSDNEPSNPDNSSLKMDLQEYLNKIPSMFQSFRKPEQSEELNNQVGELNNKSNANLSNYVESFDFRDIPDNVSKTKSKTIIVQQN